MTIEDELEDTLDTLERALLEAREELASLRRISPRVGALERTLEDVETVIEQAESDAGALATPQAMPPVAVPAARSEPEAAGFDMGPRLGDRRRRQAGAIRGRDDDLTCVRLEIESVAGTLDMHAVDEAISGDDAVRDIALMSYDGRRATLKVWTVDDARAGEAADALIASVEQRLGPQARVHIVALAEAA